MRSYGQYCALARTLDVIGERWTLLIIRELFARECRYSDLRDALPGIATNLLADRLRHLQAYGVVESYDAPAPIRAAVYRLTDRGRELGPALQALVAWGAPLVEQQGDDAFRTHWMVLGLPAYFRDVDVADLAPLTVHVQTGDQPATLVVTGSGVAMRTGAPGGDDAVSVEGDPDGVFAFLAGTGGPKGAEVSVTGPRSAVRRLHRLTRRSRAASATHA